MNINEGLIRSLAVNDSSVTNGKKLVKDFFDLKKSDDNQYYEGKCKGSGANPYFIQLSIKDEKPSFKCSCPSRQFPCKHSIGLMFCIEQSKTFDCIEIPQEILLKWQKSENTSIKRTDDAPKKVNKTALLKNIKQQLIGIELVNKFLNELLQLGISTLNTKQINEWRQMNATLDAYSIPNIQLAISEILNEIEQANQQNSDSLKKPLTLVVKLFSLCKKAKEFLSTKIQSEDTCDYENSEIYSLLGYAWKLEQLEKLGLVKENQNIAQLAFFDVNETHKKSFVEYGFWISFDDGKIYQTHNIIPYGKEKHIAKQDSCFEKLLVPKLYIYPAQRRARWNSQTMSSLSTDDILKINSFAEQDYEQVVKDVKNYFKAILNDGLLVKLIKFDKIAKIENSFAICGNDGISFRLENNFNHTPLNCFEILEENYLQGGNSLLTTFRIDDNNEIVLTPLSIVTSNEIIRLIG